jgi:DNA-directed RNA polymerase subunit L
MKIDRHNYEEFFLLYVDNELTAEQKKLVEQFIQENPDLAIELEILQQTTLQADDSIVFDGKELLLRSETDSIVNMDNYEEYLIAYIDNELNDQEKIDFFKFTMAHPQVKEELAIYQQTKLQPEKEVVFANKEILYKREEKVKVISMQWWKIAVAAAIILGIGITTITILNKKETVVPGGVAVKGSQPKEENPVPVKIEQEIKKAEQSSPVIIKDDAGTIAKTTVDDKKEKNTAVLKTRREQERKKSVLPIAETNNNETIAKNTTAPSNNNIATDNKTETKAIESVKKSNEPVKTNDVAVNNNSPKENINTIPVTKNSEVAYTNSTEIDIDPGNPVRASYEEGKNKKLRGFFRKAARAFERRTNISSADEEDKQDKVLIGALAVKLK